jgi:spermidine synthase
MGGLALGNLLAARFGARVRRPLRFYALLELAIGASGLAIVFVLPSTTPILRWILQPFLESPWILNPLRLFTSLAVMLVPATAMGATLPLMVAALFRNDPNFGRVLGRLYGWNTVGAVVGALVGEIFLVEHLGIHGTGCAAAAINTAAAALALILSRRLEPASAPVSERRRREPLSRGALGLLAAAVLLGGTLLGLEVVWFRFLSLFMLGSSTSFAVLLAVVLAGIGLGGLAGGRLVAAIPASRRHLPSVALITGATCAVMYAVFESRTNTSDGIALLRLALPLMFPVALLSGVQFTLLGAALDARAPCATRSTGLLTLCNTTGATLGSLAAGFLFLPWLGMERSLLLLAAAYGLAALLLHLAGARPGNLPDRVLLAGATALFLAALTFFPTGALRERHLGAVTRFWSQSEGSTPISFREGLTETIIYMRKDLFGEPVYHRLITNSYTMSSNNVYADRYMKLFVYLPVALHPQTRSALLISYGLGSTAEALTDTASLESIDVVDISREILEENRVVFSEPGTYPLDDPRVRVHVEDGRYFLQTTRRRFDLITGEPPPPPMAGIVSLYTREYFSLIRDRLTEGGFVSYWLPGHSLLERDSKAIIRAFCDVFRDCTLWTGAALDWILLGSRDARGPVPRTDFERQWRDETVARKMRGRGIEVPEQLGALFMGDAEHLDAVTDGVPPLTDNWPKRISNERLDILTMARVYEPWLDTVANRGRFDGSDWVRRTWPPTIREGTLARFDQQAQINQNLMTSPQARDPASVFRWLHALLTETRLEALPLWWFGSNFQIQRAAHIAAAKGMQGPVIEVQLGLGLLAARDFEAAARHFERARQGADRGSLSLYMEIYSRCMAGHCHEIENLLAPLRTPSRYQAMDRGFLAFISERFPRPDSPAEGLRDASASPGAASERLRRVPGRAAAD